MSCLDHECRECGYWWSDNNPSRVCPRCGSPETSVYFDEQDDHEPYYEEREDDE